MRNRLREAREYVSKADAMWRAFGGEEHENLDGIRALWQSLQEAEKESDED
jgi:hypothetical protein